MSSYERNTNIVTKNQSPPRGTKSSYPTTSVIQNRSCSFSQRRNEKTILNVERKQVLPYGKKTLWTKINEATTWQEKLLLMPHYDDVDWSMSVPLHLEKDTPLSPRLPFPRIPSIKENNGVMDPILLEMLNSFEVAYKTTTE
ncbi:uncharacterized protein LOC113325878 isoform X2 [Papaver somniferum]|uniref:uncharacterized protein LOC113325878 isoform X2 n=1 Tax=Papaver somniferum TaxID=3469 RepID=UPI000E702372|nr:uncharacterized protein LOC113325878 isoform X2 [Papaver somniferum]